MLLIKSLRLCCCLWQLLVVALSVLVFRCCCSCGGDENSSSTFVELNRFQTEQGQPYQDGAENSSGVFILALKSLLANRLRAVPASGPGWASWAKMSLSAYDYMWMLKAFYCSGTLWYVSSAVWQAVYCRLCLYKQLVLVVSSKHLVLLRVSRCYFLLCLSFLVPLCT